MPELSPTSQLLEWGALSSQGFFFFFSFVATLVRLITGQQEARAVAPNMSRVRPVAAPLFEIQYVFLSNVNRRSGPLSGVLHGFSSGVPTGPVISVRCAGPLFSKLVQVESDYNNF